MIYGDICPDLETSLVRLEELIDYINRVDIDIAEEAPPKESLTYRIQLELSSARTNLIIRFGDSFGKKIPSIDQVQRALDLFSELKDMSSQSMKLQTLYDDHISFLVYLASQSDPSLIPDNYCGLIGKFSLEDLF